jgi:tetratricopeptide (TPR) repeat protein
MKRKPLKMFLILILVIWGLLSVFAFSYTSGQERTVSQEAAYYTEIAMNKMEEAIKAYEGVNYPSKELWAEAIEYGEKAVQADPNYIEGHYQLAQIYQYTNWYSREAREWEKYIELIQPQGVSSPEVKKQLAFAYYRLGYTAYQREDFDACMQYLKEAVKVDPDIIEAHYWLGRVFYETGNLNDSCFSWQEVLRLDPDYPKAAYFLNKVENSITYGKEAYEHYELGYNYYEQKLLEKALFQYRQAIQYNNSFSSAYYWLGRIYYELGKYQEAANNWKQVLLLEPKNEKAEYWLKQAEKQLK